MLTKALVILIGMAIVVGVSKLISLPTTDVAAIVALGVAIYLWVDFLLLRLAILNISQFLIKKYGKKQIKEALYDETRDGRED
jgi:hypothetical protein